MYKSTCKHFSWLIVMSVTCPGKWSFSFTWRYRQTEILSNWKRVFLFNAADHRGLIISLYPLWSIKVRSTWAKSSHITKEISYRQIITNITGFVVYQVRRRKGKRENRERKKRNTLTVCVYVFVCVYVWVCVREREIGCLVIVQITCRVP